MEFARTAAAMLVRASPPALLRSPLKWLPGETAFNALYSLTLLAQ